MKIFMIIILMGVPSLAFGASETLNSTCATLLLFWNWIRTAVYVLGAISLALMSIRASAQGKFSFGNLIGWGCGLFLLASAPAFIAFLTADSATLSCPAAGG